MQEALKESPPEAAAADFSQLFDEDLQRAGSLWQAEVEREIAPLLADVRKLNRQLEELGAEFRRVTSRRLYRWSEWAALRLTALGRVLARRKGASSGEERT
jgi:class 3 adenylate cyclase